MKSKLLLCLAIMVSGDLIICHAAQTNSAPTKPEVTMSFGVNEQTNWASTLAVEQTNSMKAIADAVNAVNERLISSSTNINPTNATFTLPSTAAFFQTNVLTNVLTALTNSALPEMGEAGRFLIELKKSDHLPGVPQDRHGDMFVNAPLSAFQEAKYPFTVTFDLIAEGDSLTNHYTVVRPAKDAAWRLEKAWRTDTDGHTIKNWPVK
jgi:hypothetical protein